MRRQYTNKHQLWLFLLSNFGHGVALIWGRIIFGYVPGFPVCFIYPDFVPLIHVLELMGKGNTT